MLNRLSRHPAILICLLLFPSLGYAQTQTSTAETWSGKKSAWHGFDRYDFEVDGRPAYVVVPKQPAKGNPWVWRARFPGFHDEIDQVLVKAGFHIARINTDGMLGGPRAMKHWDAFYAFVIERGLAKKCALEGVSRGGLFVYGFASRWPDRVACIYCDTPVGDIKSWPGGEGTGRGDGATWQTCLKEYGLTEQSAKDFKGSPIDTLAPIANAKIPLMHIVSMNDTVVPPTENTLLLAQRYRQLGGSIEVIKIKTGTEQSHGHHFPMPDPQRMADFIIRHASATLP
jgi:sialidase-1